MKILVATGAYPPDIGGPATYSELLATELPKQGVEVVIQNFSAVRRYPKIIRHILFFSRMLYAGRSADVFFAQDTVSVGLPAWAAAYVLGKVFMVRVPGDYAWEQSVQRYGVTDSVDEFQGRKYGASVERLRRLQKFVVNGADRVIAPSAYFAGLVRGWLSDPSKVTHIYNGLNIDAIRKSVAGVRFEPQTVISAGRLVPWKGFAALIRTMKRLPEWHLAIAGDGPERERLAALIADQGLSDRVTLLGRVGSDDLLKRIAGSEVFVLNTSFESFSFQIVETMAAGTPVITTTVGNLSEIIDDGVSGLLVKPDDETALAAGITRIHTDPSLRSKLVAGARTKAEKFSIGSTVREVLAQVSSAIQAHEAAAPSRLKYAKLARYLFSGGMAAITNIVLYDLLIYAAHIWYVIASVLAFVVAFGVSFVLQKFFTFQDHDTDGVRGQAAIYLAVTSANLVVNTGLIYLFVEYLGMGKTVALILSSIILAIESYVIYGMFIFKNRPARSSL